MNAVYESKWISIFTSIKIEKKTFTKSKTIAQKRKQTFFNFCFHIVYFQHLCKKTKTNVEFHGRCVNRMFRHPFVMNIIVRYDSLSFGVVANKTKQKHRFLNIGAEQSTICSPIIIEVQRIAWYVTGYKFIQSNLIREEAKVIIICFIQTLNWEFRWKIKFKKKIINSSIRTQQKREEKNCVTLCSFTLSVVMIRDDRIR